ncbi:BAG family molecular chaperone regulator 8 chloroplastic [Tripterygium wilfordii]|uniref:BAG family molecular chaperone regulator 8 chloroplastic n=1 Tax=Tripterygium wilfordii TaxID=458696 RepID=A0A7J7BTS1_TRIWF|nr:BAG family molecular chaperone regulator 8, chloroplastic-like [Tripterygium wilfordii]KAF5725393.1 BAG family molecular chaperone regulator 8 chloroplastic [Tripterygium wilfordii]
MASHHHCCHPNPPPTTATTTWCCSSTHCYDQKHQLAPPQSQPQAPADPLLQTIATLLQQQSLSTYPTKSQTLQNPQLQKQQYEQQKTFLKQQELHSQTQSILSSLLERINVLESSLHRLCTFGFYHSPSSSVRDAAARVIQTHFRAFLVRRSRTLRQLKEVAFIRSSFNSLKSSVSNETHFNVDVVYQQAMDLLLKLDSIQDGDPMIRDGKRSVSRELVRFLEFVDQFAVKRHAVSFQSRKGLKLVHKGTKSRNLRNSNSTNIQADKKEIIDNLRERIEKIHNFTRVCENDEEEVEFEGFHQVINEDDDDHDNKSSSRSTINGKSGIPKTRNGILIPRNGSQLRVRKSVSFAVNGSLSRVFGNAREPVSGGEGLSTDGSVSSDDEEEAVENKFEDYNGFFRDAKDNKAHMEDGGSLQSSDGVNFTFSTPVPVKMENRVDLLNKRKAGKIAI